MLLGGSRKPNVRVIKVDGVEIHRCASRLTSFSAALVVREHVDSLPVARDAHKRRFLGRFRLPRVGYGRNNRASVR